MADAYADSIAGAPAAAAPATAGAPLRPLTFREKASYASGNVAEVTINYPLGAFFLFYLTAVCGLSGTVAGVVLSLTIVVDALMDPFVGYWSDTTRSRWGRRHPFLFLSLIPLAITFGLLFTLPPALHGWLLAVYVFVLLLLQRVVHSAFTLPFGALGAEITRDYADRSSLGAFNAFFVIVGQLIVAFLGLSVFLKGNAAQLDRSAYSAYGWTCAGIVLAVGFFCAAVTLPMRGRMHQITAPQPVSLSHFFSGTLDCFKHRSFRILFFAVLVNAIGAGIAASLALHVVKYFWVLPAAVMGALPLVGLAGVAVGIPFAAFLLRRFEKKPVAVWACRILACLALVPIGLRLTGVLPASGDALYWFLYANSFVVGCIGVSVGISCPAMLIDSADEHELLYNARREGLYFAAFGFSAKAAIAFGTVIGGLGLDLIGFPKNIAAMGLTPDLAPELVRNLALAQALPAALCTFTASLMISGYKIDAKRHAEIRAELDRRHAAG